MYLTRCDIQPPIESRVTGVPINICDNCDNILRDTGACSATTPYFRHLHSVATRLVFADDTQIYNGLVYFRLERPRLQNGGKREKTRKDKRQRADALAEVITMIADDFLSDVAEHLVTGSVRGKLIKKEGKGGVHMAARLFLTAATMSFFFLRC